MKTSFSHSPLPMFNKQQSLQVFLKKSATSEIFLKSLEAAISLRILHFIQVEVIFFVILLDFLANIQIEGYSLV